MCGGGGGGGAQQRAALPARPSGLALSPRGPYLLGGGGGGGGGAPRAPAGGAFGGTSGVVGGQRQPACCQVKGCGMETGPAGLEAHVAAAHPEVAEQANTCKLCGAGPYGHVDNLAKHKRFHDPDATWSCPTAGCGGVFGTDAELRTHVRQQHPRARLFCTEAHVAGCGPDSKARAGPALADGKKRGFGSAQGLQRHINGVHRGIKYICDNCGKEYTQPGHLHRHQEKDHQ